MMTSDDWGREVIKALAEFSYPVGDWRIAIQVHRNLGRPTNHIDRVFYDVREWLDKVGEPTGSVKTTFSNGHTLYSIDVLQRLTIEAG